VTLCLCVCVTLLDTILATHTQYTRLILACQADCFAAVATLWERSLSGS
jgi:hypothetical protein